MSIPIALPSHRRALAALAVILPFTAVGVTAQQSAAPVVVVRAARMLDMASGQMLRNVSVVVTGDRDHRGQPGDARRPARA